jgi:hypothetical protein
MSTCRLSGAILGVLCLCFLGSCNPNRWISNSFGAFAIRDVTGDGFDDYVGWFINFGLMTRTRLIVIDGRTGKSHFSCIANSKLIASLNGNLVVTAADRWSQKGVLFKPEIGLYDLAANRTIHITRVEDEVSRLCTTEQGVIAYAGSEGFLVDSKAGTINPVADGEPARCVDSNAIADTSSLAVMPSADWPASVAGLRVATARSRDLGAGATLWLAVGAADGRPIVAKVQHGQVLWHIGLGRSSGSFAWVPANAVSNGTHWFVPYVDGGIARLAAIDNSTGAQVWDIEILTRPGKPQEWHVCAMDAGPNLVGLAHKRMNDCDELVLVDAVAGKVAYRYKRN